MNSSTTSDAPQSEFIEALNQTEIGAFLAKHLTLIISLVVLSIISIIGWGIYSYQAKQDKIAYAQEVYQFRQSVLVPFQSEGSELVASEVTTQFKDLYAALEGSIVAFPTLIELSDELVSKGEKESALEVIELAENYSDPYALYFVNTRKAALLEDLGRTSEALTALEQVRDNSAELLTDKLYLDLGRLYRAEGELEMAKASFQEVVNNMAQNEFAALARIYLNELEAQ